jgi:hypothetical protein
MPFSMFLAVSIMIVIFEKIHVVSIISIALIKLFLAFWVGEISGLIF